MRKLFYKLFWRAHLFIYRLSGGRIGGEILGLHILILTTNGRKSGKVRTTALGYFRHNESYIVIASNIGSDHHPGWYYNLKSNPAAAIQIKQNRISVRAEQAIGEERHQLWDQLIRISPYYAGYQKSTSREIPVMILSPTHL